ncbi:MAG: PAS domain S-box protein [Pseudomonadota bacterium]
MTRHDPPGNQPVLPPATAVVSQLPSPVVLIEETGRILMVNAAAAAAFGETEENLTGRLMVDTPLPSALGADARDLVAKAEGRFPGALYHEYRGAIYRFTAKIVDPARPCRVIGLFGRDITSLHGDGAPSASAQASLEEVIKERSRALAEANEKFRRQINERLQVEKALRASEQKYRSIFENIQDVYVETSPDGIILEVSPSVGNLFSYRREELIGKSVLDVCFDPSERSGIVAAIMRDGQIKNREIRLKDKDGSVHHCLFSARLVTDDAGNPLKSATSLKDITALKRTEAELEKTRETLYQAQKMKSLGTLVAGVAHEINNPVNLILFNLPLFRDLWMDTLPVLTKTAVRDGVSQIGGLSLDYLKENLGQLIDDTELAAKRIAAIVGNLKDFYRRSETRDMSAISLNGAVENALRLAGASLRKAGVAIDVALTPELPEMVGNPQSVEQICLNILLNAVEAIDHDHGHIDVRTGRSTDGRLYFSIADNGKGISPEVAPTIFDPFVTDKQAYGGTGLGLSVSYSLVQAHRGEIQASARDGCGTVFTVHFPTRSQFQSAKIMLIDDDDLLRGYLEEQLHQRAHYQVLAMSGGLAACLRLGTYRPDVVVLDVFMPDVDGLEVCRIMKKDPVLSTIPVIVTTGQPDHPLVEKIRALGFTLILEKPLRIETLMETIEGALTP